MGILMLRRSCLGDLEVGGRRSEKRTVGSVLFLCLDYKMMVTLSFQLRNPLCSI